MADSPTWSIMRVAFFLPVRRSGDISELSVDAVVHSTNESMSERSPHSDRIHLRAGRSLRDEIINEVIGRQSRRADAHAVLPTQPSSGALC